MYNLIRKEDMKMKKRIIAICLVLVMLFALSACGKKQEAAPAAREELPEITMIARAGQKMSPERRQDMLRLLKIAFPEEFRDDDGA